jgi:hypothetical protein
VVVLDPVAVKGGHEFVAEAITADRAGQRDLGAKAARGDGLVEALAAQDPLDRRRVNRFAGAREVGQRGDQVVVQTARDRDPRDSTAPPIIRCLAPA